MPGPGRAEVAHCAAPHCPFSSGSDLPTESSLVYPKAEGLEERDVGTDRVALCPIPLQL